MWIVRQFSRTTDELVEEHELGLDTENLASILGFAPTPYGSTRLAPDQLSALVRAAGIDVPPRPDLEPVLDFDAEPASSAPAEHTTSASRRR